MTAILAAALLPIIILLGFILRKDKNKPEPPGKLLKAFVLGMLSVIPALILVAFFDSLGLGPGEEPTAWNAILDAFWQAAIPEEIAKLGMLWLVLRKNPYFDEKMDGIVYAACVALGFAATENLLYLTGNAENYVQVGISRALFAVPGHFCDGVLMGYFYSRAHFGTTSRTRNRILILAAPILAHGVYDSLLFVAQVSEALSGILTTLFVVFCCQLWKYASRRITEHLVADGMLQLPPVPGK